MSTLHLRDELLAGLQPYVAAARPEQVVENMAALDVVERLTDDAVDRIEEILDNRPKGEPDYR